MADIEKVIKGLECCLRESEHIDDNPCADCPYYDIDSGVGGKCIDDKDRDALELLKELKKQRGLKEEKQPKYPCIDCCSPSERAACCGCPKERQWQERYGNKK